MSTLPPPLPVSGVLNGWIFRQVSSSSAPAPGPEGGTLTSTYIQPGSISNHAQVVFAQTVNNASNVAAGEGLFMSRSGPRNNARELQQPRNPIWQVVRTGEPILTNAVFSSTLGPSVVNGAGQVGFAANYTTTTTPAQSQSGIFRFVPRLHQVSAQVLPGDLLPNGAKFVSANSPISLSNRGAIAFGAYSNLAPNTTGINGSTLGTGVFVVGPGKKISQVAAPGDDAPFPLRDRVTATPKFDYASDPSINDFSHVAFVGHQTSDPAALIDPANPNRLLGGNLYFVRPNQAISMIVQQGTKLNAANGGATIAYGTDPIANNSGQVLFHGSIAGTSGFGVFQFSPAGGITKIAQPGDALPDGGAVASINVGSGTLGYNDVSDAAFVATSTTGSTGIYIAKKGRLVLVAKTGDTIPALGLGAISSLSQGSGKTSGPIINADDQILFAAKTDQGFNTVLAASWYKTVVAKAKSK